MEVIPFLGHVRHLNQPWSQKKPQFCCLFRTRAIITISNIIMHTILYFGRLKRWQEITRHIFTFRLFGDKYIWRQNR